MFAASPLITGPGCLADFITSQRSVMGGNEQLFSRGPQSVTFDLSQCRQWASPEGWAERGGNKLDRALCTPIVPTFTPHAFKDCLPALLEMVSAEHAHGLRGAFPVGLEAGSIKARRRVPATCFLAYANREVRESEAIQSVFAASGWPRN